MCYGGESSSGQQVVTMLGEENECASVDESAARSPCTVLRLEGILIRSPSCAGVYDFINELNSQPADLIQQTPSLFGSIHRHIRTSPKTIQ